jgi:glycerol-3-phosphate responsive antiterminator
VPDAVTIIDLESRAIFVVDTRSVTIGAGIVTHSARASDSVEAIPGAVARFAEHFAVFGRVAPNIKRVDNIG